MLYIATLSGAMYCITIYISVTKDDKHGVHASSKHLVMEILTDWMCEQCELQGYTREIYLVKVSWTVSYFFVLMLHI